MGEEVSKLASIIIGRVILGGMGLALRWVYYQLMLISTTKNRTGQSWFFTRVKLQKPVSLCGCCHSLKEP